MIFNNDKNIWNLTETYFENSDLFLKLLITCIVRHLGQIFKEMVAGLNIQ